MNTESEANHYTTEFSAFPVSSGPCFTFDFFRASSKKHFHSNYGSNQYWRPAEQHKKLWLRDQRRTYTGAPQKWAWFDCCSCKEGETRNTTNHFHMISLVEAYTACTVWRKIHLIRTKKEADGSRVCCGELRHEPITRLLAFLLHTSHQHQRSHVCCLRLAMISITGGCMSNINTQCHCRSSDDDKWWLDIKWITALKGGKSEDV